MPKRLINKYLPHASKLKSHRSLRWLGAVLHDSNLWHLNRRSVASAVFVGIFAAFLPFPLQMMFAAILAIFLHANLPLSVTLVWISNPLTYAPIFYACYRFGLIILNQDYTPEAFVWQVDSVWQNFLLIWQPLLLGCLISGLVFGLIGYISVRLLWRLHIQRIWVHRKSIRAKQLKNKIRMESERLKDKAINARQHLKENLQNHSCDNKGCDK